MLIQDRTLLRLHIEAVWNLQIPLIEQESVDLLPENGQPTWKLCATEIQEGRVLIWRRDVPEDERKVLRLQIEQALDFSSALAAETGISREIAFSWRGIPGISSEQARCSARLLTVDDRALLEKFQVDTAENYLQPEQSPLIGVLEAGKLVSLAHSSRRTQEACELGLDTLPEARRRGYALAATIVWTQAVIREGLVPLYSALAENKASLRLAEKAGYRSFARAATLQ